VWPTRTTKSNVRKGHKTLSVNIVKEQNPEIFGKLKKFSEHKPEV